jgi:hypothetical protein
MKTKIIISDNVIIDKSDPDWCTVFYKVLWFNGRKMIRSASGMKFFRGTLTVSLADKILSFVSGKEIKKESEFDAIKSDGYLSGDNSYSPKINTKRKISPYEKNTK